MIVQIEGKLVALESGAAVVRVGSFCYEVLLPGYAVSFLSGKIGQDITLCTMEHYEGTPVGGNLIPRMVGFLTQAEKDFFVKYTSVKGMGIRKALKSLTIPIASIADAIEAGDEKMLTALPGVGKRFAQQIIAGLKGKLGDFALGAGADSAGAKRESFERFQIEALEILIAWGERRPEAMELIALACKKHPDIKTAEQLVPVVYRIKQGVEV